MIKKILKENYIYILIIVVLTILLTLVMKSSLLESIVSFDYNFVSFMKDISGDKLTFIFKFITNFGDIYVPLIILLFIFIFVRNNWYFILESSGYLIAGVLTYLIKLIVSRPRPIEALIRIPSSFSFPSGHTLTSLVFYGLLFYLISAKSNKKTKIISFIVALFIIILVAISRIYLGVHYFTDVLGGFVIGIPCLMMIINIIEKNFKEKL